MNRLVIFILIFICFLNLSENEAYSKNSTAVVHFENAKELLLSGSEGMGQEVLDAIKELKTAIKMDPNFASAHELLGDAYLKMGLSFQRNSKERKESFELTEEHYRKAVALDPDNPDYLYELAQFLEDQTEVFEILKTIISSSPDFAPARKSYARRLENRGEIELAIGEYQKYLDLVAKSGGYASENAYFRLWGLLINQNRHEEAIGALSQYIDVERKHIVAEKLRRLDFSSLSVEQYSHFLEKVNKIKNFENRVNIDEAYKLLGANNLQEAMEKFLEQINVNPYAANHYREFAQALEKKGHYKEAYIVYEKLLDSDNQVADKCWYLGNVRLQKKFVSEDGSLPSKLKSICDSKITFVE